MTAKLAETIAEAAKPDFEVYELSREDFAIIEPSLAACSAGMPRADVLRERFASAHTAFILSEPEQP